MVAPVINVEAFKVIRDVAINDPDSFDMSIWEGMFETWDDDDEPTHCGTTRCIAGWALYNAGQPIYNDAGYDHQIPARAAKVLGITPDDQWIFHVSDDEAKMILYHIVEHGEIPTPHNGKTSRELAASLIQWHAAFKNPFAAHAAERPYPDPSSGLRW